VEPSIAEGVVQFAGRKAAELFQTLGAHRRRSCRVPVSVLDGNHLRKSAKRLGALRGLSAAALPGTVVAKLNLDTHLFERAYLLEDAHAKRARCSTASSPICRRRGADRRPALLHRVVPAGRGRGRRLFRDSATRRLQGEPVGERQFIGRGDTGIVYEQDLRIHDSNGPVVTSGGSRWNSTRRPGR